MLTADNKSHEVRSRYQISECGFRFGETMFVGIKFNFIQNMIVNNEFKQRRGTTESRNEPAVALSVMIASFEYWHNGRFFPSSKEVLLNQAQYKNMSKNWNKNY
jgi:hypothetical protein